MSGRVTQSMMNSQLLRNLSQNMARLDNLQNQAATSRKINKPSDDPVGISFAMRYRSEIAANDQYLSNVDSAMSWLDNSDVTLGQVGDVFHRVRELTVNAANGSNPELALDSIKQEIGELKNQLIDVGNTKFNGKYIFNGQMTDVPPYDQNPIADTDLGAIDFEIGVGVKLAVNVTGNQIFGKCDAEDNAFKVLDDLMLAMENSDFKEISALLEKVDSRMDAIIKERAEIGAKTNRLELTGARLEDISINMQTLQAKTEDADMAVVITNLAMAENVYQASLGIGAKLIRPSLIDFLR